MDTPGTANGDAVAGSLSEGASCWAVSVDTHLGGRGTKNSVILLFILLRSRARNASNIPVNSHDKMNYNGDW